MQKILIISILLIPFGAGLIIYFLKRQKNRGPMINMVAAIGSGLPGVLSAYHLWRLIHFPAGESGDFLVTILWNWFLGAHVHVPVMLQLDFYSLPALITMNGIMFLIILLTILGFHRESARSETLLALIVLQLAVSSFISAGSLLVAILGWSGITVSLYLFFQLASQHSRNKVNALRIFVPMFAFDIALIFSSILVTVRYSSMQYIQFLKIMQLSANVTADPVMWIIGLLCFISVAGKMGLFPFFFWLRRVEELRIPERLALYTVLMPSGLIFMYRLEWLFDAQVQLRMMMGAVGLLSAMIALFFLLALPGIRGRGGYIAAFQCALLTAAFAANPTGDHRALWAGSTLTIFLITASTMWLARRAEMDGYFPDDKVSQLLRNPEIFTAMIRKTPVPVIAGIIAVLWFTGAPGGVTHDIFKNLTTTAMSPAVHAVLVAFCLTTALMAGFAGMKYLLDAMALAFASRTETCAGGLTIQVILGAMTLITLGVSLLFARTPSMVTGLSVVRWTAGLAGAGIMAALMFRGGDFLVTIRLKSAWARWICAKNLGLDLFFDRMIVSPMIWTGTRIWDFDSVIFSGSIRNVSLWACRWSEFAGAFDQLVFQKVHIVTVQPVIQFIQQLIRLSSQMRWIYYTLAVLILIGYLFLTLFN